MNRTRSPQTVSHDHNQRVVVEKRELETENAPERVEIMPLSQPSTCILCGRTPQRGTTEHHLIPRTCHTNKWFKKRFSREQMRETISVCKDCHRTIHQMIPREKDLGRHYYTIELLRAHEQFGRYVAWARCH